jgi:putative heme iron utilization protein
MGKVIQFKKKPREEINTMQRKKEIAHFLIDECYSDFALVFKTKDVEHVFDGIEEADFIVALTDIAKSKVDNEDYFFAGFSSRQYFDLNS